jgi:hypothetical protein
VPAINSVGLKSLRGILKRFGTTSACLHRLQIMHGRAFPSWIRHQPSQASNPQRLFVWPVVSLGPVVENLWSLIISATCSIFTSARLSHHLAGQRVKLFAQFPAA